MSEGTTGLGCPLKLWIISALIGVVLALLLVIGGFEWLAGMFLGVVACGLIGMFLTWLLCVSPQDGPRRQAAFSSEDPDVAVAIAKGEIGEQPEAAAMPAREQIAAMAEPVAEAPAPQPEPAPEPAPTPEPVAAAPEPETGEAKPVTLDAARAGGADDLKKIKGVGPKLETTLNELGFYHYDQIAAWTEAEIAWVDSRLKFKGRIERDDWIAQAAELAKG